VRLADSDGDAPSGPIGPVRNVRLVGGASRVMSGHASLRQRMRRRRERFERDEVECAAVQTRPRGVPLDAAVIAVVMIVFMSGRGMVDRPPFAVILCVRMSGMRVVVR